MPGADASRIFTLAGNTTMVSLHVGMPKNNFTSLFYKPNHQHLCKYDISPFNSWCLCHFTSLFYKTKHQHLCKYNILSFDGWCFSHFTSLFYKTKHQHLSIHILFPTDPLGIRVFLTDGAAFACCSIHCFALRVLITPA